MMRPEAISDDHEAGSGDLFAPIEPDGWQRVSLAPGAMWLRGFALGCAPALWVDLKQVLEAAPPRHMITRGGFRMSVAMSNCGALGWVSDAQGYRYDAIDPDSGRPWPAMPASFVELAQHASREAGYRAFTPDACLISRYEPGARLTLHQDRDEHGFAQPIVSCSLGLPATFLLGGLTRSDRAIRVPVNHGDVIAWGGPARLRFHGVAVLADGDHRLTGRYRVNLSFRRAA
jgi:alkylated DNA repair protein (DNA oxidative demethylase)